MGRDFLKKMNLIGYFTGLLMLRGDSPNWERAGTEEVSWGGAPQGGFQTSGICCPQPCQEGEMSHEQASARYTDEGKESLGEGD